MTVQDIIDKITSRLSELREIEPTNPDSIAELSRQLRTQEEEMALSGLLVWIMEGTNSALRARLEGAPACPS